MNDQEKVQGSHLARKAYLYIRQSTLRQVFEHEEGRRRQYQLQEQARLLGWAEDQIVVIDCDLGLSGASADREGFQRLVAEVGLGKAGMVMGLEVSRLARNSTDWHRLLEICALTETLILDEDGLYDPQHFNDRLLLGLKGTLSEAELHVIRARLQGGIRNKARRGELRTPLPIGFVYDEAGRVVLDPDQQVQETLHLFFRTFRRIGTALGTVRYFKDHNLSFPKRPVWSRRPVEWGELDFSTAWRLLGNPRYAGIYFFGATRQRRLPDGRGILARRPREEWIAYQQDAHPGYLSVAEHELNLRQLNENGRRNGADHRSCAREGTALLQGLALCGRCGRHMRVHYYHRRGVLIPTYICPVKTGPQCQYVHGSGVDEAIETLLLEMVTPLTLELALEVHSELSRRLDEAQRLQAQRVERARYEAELARDRFMQVDPRHRLVATNLEAEWNEKLRLLAEAKSDLERQANERPELSQQQRDEVLGLSSDFPRLWQDPRTPVREKKRLLRLLIEDVTLVAGDLIEAHVRFRGGPARSLKLPRPINALELRRTPVEVVRVIDDLLDQHSEEEVSAILNQRGLKSGTGIPFQPKIVASIRRAYGLQNRRERLRKTGALTAEQAARRLHVGRQKLHQWVAEGRVRSLSVAPGVFMYQIASSLVNESRQKEVQYEA
ncbi:MAG: recombinase family protein [Actinomycetota bacterium]|nr:recombinase family protein [Actinomycetota bacterium]